MSAATTASASSSPSHGPRRTLSIFSPASDSSDPAPILSPPGPPPLVPLPAPSPQRPLVSVVLFKLTDLRTHDHAPLAVGNAHPRALAALPSYRASLVPHPAPHSRLSSGTSSAFPYHAITHCLPLTLFDPRLFGSSSLSTFGFPRTGPIRAHLCRQSVSELSDSLSARFGSGLLVRLGRAEEVVPAVVRRLQDEGADVAVLTYDEWAWEEQVVQAELGRRLAALGVPLLTFWGSTLVHLHDLPFPMSHLPPVFTQFRLAVERKWKVRDWRDFTMDGRARPLPRGWAEECGLVPTMAELGYEEGRADAAWEPSIDRRSVVQWRGGEREAMKRVEEYVWGSESIRQYKATRNALLGVNNSSKLSPFLCQGSLSVSFVHAEVERFERERVKNDSTRALVFELLWRDYFRFYALHHSRRLFFPYSVKGRQRVLRDRALVQPEWNDAPAMVEAWTQGRTGYPFVDANMRELLYSGWMSNRGRQVVASFLIKDMKMDWRIGAEWFEARLLDYDCGSNWGNWAYLAGVGGDPRSARYFSVPKQQATHDADGEFVGLWIPALKKRAPPSILDALKHSPAQQQPHPSGDAENAAGDGGAQSVLLTEPYDCAPIVSLLHEAKRVEQPALSRKQGRGGMRAERVHGSQQERGAGEGAEVVEVTGAFFTGVRGSGVRSPGRAGGGGVRGRGASASPSKVKQLSMDAFVRR